MRSNTISIAPAILAALYANVGVSQTANPENITEDEIIIIGARSPIPRAEMTAAITVLDGEDIEALGAVFAADALRTVPGVAVNRSGPAGTLTQVRLRGSEANHVLVLIDGIEASNPFTGAFSFNTMPSNGVSRLEVLRGEQSALWGSDAIGGVINMVTTPKDDANTPSGGAFVEYGSFETVRTGANGQAMLHKTRLFGNVSFADAQGYDVSGNDGEKDGYDNFTAFAGADTPLGNIANLKTRARFTRAHNDFDSDTDFDGRLNDVERRQRQNQFDVLAEITAQSHNGHFEHVLKTTHTTSEDVNPGSNANGFRTQGSYQLNGHWQTGSVEHHISFLGEIEREIYKNNGGPGALETQKRRNTMNALAADYRLVSNGLVLNASARRDTQSLFANSTTWRIGAAYAIAPLNGRVRASAGQGTKNPGFFELFGFFPDFFTGNPNLTPERSTGYELGWEQDIGPAKLSFSGYSSRLKNEIFTDFSTFPFTADNRPGKSRRRGLEIEGQWPLNTALTLTGSATFQHTTQDKAREIRRPRFLASAVMHWQPQGQPFGLSLGADHNGKMSDTDFGSFSDVTLKSYTLVHGTAHYDVGKNLQLFVRGDNLLDQNYTEVFGFKAQGRGVYGGIRAKF